MVAARLQTWVRSFRAWIANIFAKPEVIIPQHLSPGEFVIHTDAPAFNSFVVDELPLVALTFGVGGLLAVWGLNTHNLDIGGVALIGTGGLLMYLRIKRWTQRYTAYVLTSMRVMRISGVINRSSAWIPWAKVTDVRYEASLAGRILGYATVYIESANEASGLAAMRNLHDPKVFYSRLTEMVNYKQGNLQPSVLVD